MNNDAPYLGEVLSTDLFQKAFLNLVDTPCGSGKTHFALYTLAAKFARNYSRAVYLIDTCMGTDALVKKHEFTTDYHPNWMTALGGDFDLLPSSSDGAWFDGNQLFVLNTAKFGTVLKHHPEMYKELDLIICDEFPEFFWKKDAKIAAIKQTLPAANDEEIEEILKMGDYNTICYEGLKRFITDGKCLVVALSATPRKICEHFEGQINHIIPPASVRRYTVANEIEYTSLDYVLKKLERIPGVQYMLYIPHVTKMIEYRKRLCQLGFRAEAIWSKDQRGEKRMNKAQLKLRQDIIETESIPDYIDVFIFNKACETSININNDNIAAIIVHSPDRDVQTQARGRLRNNLATLYIYNKNKSTSVVPAEYLNTPLNTSRTAELCKILNFQDKHRNSMGWTNTRKKLIDMGYRITKAKKNDKKWYYTVEEVESTSQE